MNPELYAHFNHASRKQLTINTTRIVRSVSWTLHYKSGDSEGPTERFRIGITFGQLT